MPSFSESESKRSATEGEYYQKEINDYAPKLFSQTRLNDLSRELNLSKETAQLLASRLKEKNLLEKNAPFAWCRHREKEFRKSFSKENTLVYCQDVQGLIKTFGISYKTED